MAARLAGAEVVIARKVGETEALYGSVTSGDIAEALSAKGFDIDTPQAAAGRGHQEHRRGRRAGEAAPRRHGDDQGEGRSRRLKPSEVKVRTEKVKGPLFLLLFPFPFPLFVRLPLPPMHYRATAERTLPHNLEAERSVLGAILLHNDAFNLAAEVIDSEPFLPRCASPHLRQDGPSSPSAATLSISSRSRRSLARAGEIDEVGGPAYIAALVDGVPRSTNVEHYARIVKEKGHPPESDLLGQQDPGRWRTTAEEEADVILDQAEHAIFAIADDKVRDGFVSMRTLAQSSLETIEKLHAKKELITGVPTGFTDLDEMTSGLQSGDLVIIAARPSMGKTSLVLNMAQHVGTKTDRSVGIFSLEMSKEQLFLRMLTAEARIDAHRLRGGFLGERDWGRLSQAIGTLREAKIFIDDSPSIGVLEMRAKCRRLKSEHGLHLVVVDYIQLMQGRGRFENRTLELASISRSMKGLAKELSVPIVVLSQLSRAPESRSDHRPQLSDLARVGRPRAGRRRRHVHLSRGRVRGQERAADRRRRGRPSSSSASSATVRPAS